MLDRSLIRRSCFVPPLALACLLTAQALYAAPLTVTPGVHAMFARSKTVKFKLHNGSAAEMDLRAGDTAVTLKAGETITLDLPSGTRIVTSTASGDQPAGTLVLQVMPGFSGTTITLH
jgi:hypothetical protein